METISKKKLLEETGISYGQLYRWKREKIIPEEWFIKKSTFTGQETIFPKKKILDRVEKIMKMKDSYSLRDLHEYFTTFKLSVSFNYDELKMIDEFDEKMLKILLNLYKYLSYSFNEIIILFSIAIANEELNFNEKDLNEIILKGLLLADRNIDEEGSLFIFSLNNKYYLGINNKSNSCILDDDIEIVKSINLCEVSDNIKNIFKEKYI